MKTDRRPWGPAADGSKAHLYVMESEGGLSVTVSDYGGTVTGVLGLDLDDPDDYRRYTEEAMWATKCRDVIKTAIELAYDIPQ